MVASFADILTALPGYEVRPQQHAMIDAIKRALKADRHLIVEAGTGSGKSFGYLYPLLEQGERVVVSTGTIALQEQLIREDIPFMAKASGKKWHAVLAKGRHHYLALQKLWEMDRHVMPHDPMRAPLDLIKAELDEWDGDRANLTHAVPGGLWDEVASSTEDCLGRRCEHHGHCFYFQSRSLLHEADVIVTNHALYMVDLASGGALLPPHRVVVFDEAHHLARVAEAAFTATIGRYSATKILQKLRRRIGPIPDRLMSPVIDSEAALLDWLLSANRREFRINPDSEFLMIVERLAMALEEIRGWLGHVSLESLPFPDDSALTKAALHRQKLDAQLGDLLARWSFFGEETADRVNWASVESDRGYFELKSTPLSVADVLHEQLWSKKTAILCSATLAVDRDFRFAKQSLGLDVADELVLQSPFDYPSQAALFIPPGLPEPNAPHFWEAALPAVKAAIEMSGGRALILFSSYRALEKAFQGLEDLPYPIARQGDLPQRRLIQWFKETPGAVLLATSTYWEGIDIPGEALSLLVIERLPFAVPDDPVVQAKVERLKAKGDNWFRQWMLPEAVMRLRQGVGRLVRSKRDKGLIVILDSRLDTKGYGRDVLKALPPATRIRRLDLARPFLCNGESVGE